jgi:hypothetical protein
MVNIGDVDSNGCCCGDEVVIGNFVAAWLISIDIGDVDSNGCECGDEVVNGWSDAAMGWQAARSTWPGMDESRSGLTIFVAAQDQDSSKMIGIGRSNAQPSSSE